MKISSTALVVLALFCGVATQVRAEAKQKINDYLIANVVSDSDVEANFAALEKFMAEVKKKSSSFFGSETLGELEILVPMKNTISRCNDESYSSLGRAADRWKSYPRVYSLMNSVKAKHVKDCLDRLPDDRKKRFAMINPKTRALLNEYTDIVIKYIRVNKPKASFAELLNHNIKTTRNVHHNQEVMEMALRELKNDPKENYYETDTNIMCYKYIVKPCEVYSLELRGVFSDWTAAIEHDPAIQEDRKYEEMNTEYYRYKVCENLVNQGRHNLYKDIGDIRTMPS